MSIIYYYHKVDHILIYVTFSSAALNLFGHLTLLTWNHFRGHSVPGIVYVAKMLLKRTLNMTTDTEYAKCVIRGQS